MTAQLELFGSVHKPRTAQIIDRRTGLPVAALRKAQAVWLEAVVGLGDANAWECQQWLRARGKHAPETNAFTSRCNEMASVGWVRRVGERPGPTGRPQDVYESTAAGREALIAFLGEPT